MVSTVLPFSLVQKVVVSIPSKIKTKTLNLVSAASSLSMQHLGVQWSKSKDGSAGVRIICLGKVDCCFQPFVS